MDERLYKKRLKQLKPVRFHRRYLAVSRYRINVMRLLKQIQLGHEAQAKAAMERGMTDPATKYQWQAATARQIRRKVISVAFLVYVTEKQQT